MGMSIDMGMGMDMDIDRGMGLDMGMDGSWYVYWYVDGYGDVR